MGSLFTLALFAQAVAVEGPVRPVVVVSEGVNGDFVSTACDQQRLVWANLADAGISAEVDAGLAPDDEHHELPEPPEPTNDVPATAGLHSVSREFEFWPDAIRIDVGNFFGAAALSDILITHDVRAVVDMVRLLQLRGLVMGRRELATARPTLLLLANALKNQKHPFVLNNLRCDASAQAVCDAVVASDSPAFTIDTPSAKVALVSALAKEVLDQVAPDRAAGLHLDEPVDALARATESAHAQGAQWVIAVFDGRRQHELEDTLELSKQLSQRPMPQRPDVLVALHLSDQLTSFWPAADTDDAPVPVVASSSRRAVQVWPHRALAPNTGPRSGWPVVPPLSANARELAEWASAEAAWVCETYDDPNQSWPLTHPLDERELTNVLLDSFRERTRTEVALFSRASLHAPSLERAKLTPLDVATMLPFDTALRTTRLTGSALKKIIDGDAKTRALLFRGVTVNDKGDVRVNGRALEPTQPYTVVTSDYLASGADGVFTEKTFKFSSTPRLTAREVFFSHLNRRLRARLPGNTVLADPAYRARWLFRATADVSFSFVRLQNPAPTVFTDAQLARSNAFAFRGDIDARADADHPDYPWENDLRLRYGLSRTAAADGSAVGVTETDDLLFLRNTATLRHWAGAQAKPYLPVPFVESYVESEFSQPTTRPYHHLEWRPITGFRLLLLTELSVFAGVGLDWETLALPAQRPAYEPVAAGVFVGGAALRPRALFNVGATPLTGEGSLDVSWRDPLGTSSALVRLRLKLSMPVIQGLALTVAYDLFARYIHPALLSSSGAITTTGFGVANDLVVGFSAQWAEVLQAFEKPDST